MEKVRIGIIGFGRMGLTHYSIINTHPAVEMTAIADTSSTMLNMIKKYLPAVKMFEDYKDLLKSGLVDAVIICTPSILHYDACKLAGEKGIAVFCEKPFTTSPEKALELADLFEGKGLVNQVGYVYRFDVVFNKVKEYLEAGLIGDICHVNAQFLSATISSAKPAKGWRAKRENGGGATYEMGSHVFDLMNFFLGKQTKVYGSLLNKVYSDSVEDVCSVDVQYNGTTTCSMHVNWSDYTYRKPMLKLDFHGTKGKIQADLYGLKVFLREENKQFNLPEGWTSTPMNMLPDPCPYYVRGTSFTNQLYAFADAVLANKKTTGCSFREAAETQELIHTIFEKTTKNNAAMEKIDKIVFGDNQFFGINHRSQEKAEEMLKRFSDVHNILKVYDDAFDCGVKAVMLNSNDRAEEICQYFRDHKSQYGDIVWYPSVPYPHKYANMVNELGIFPAINEVLLKGNSVGAMLSMIGKGASAVFTKDGMKMMDMLLDVEFKIFRGLNVNTFFMLNPITDLLLGYNIKEVFEHYCEYVRKKYKCNPGLITLNMPYLKSKLEEWGIDEVVICSSINAAGFNMHPSKEAYEKAIAENDPSKYQLMAMNVLASGSISVQESFDYINSLNLQSVTFGASSKGHIQSSFDAIKI